MTKVIVDRAKWNRGDFEHSALLNEYGMCCLGFACIALGLTEEDIRDLRTPADVRGLENKPAARKIPLLLSGNGGNSFFAHKLMVANDKQMDDTERETQIIHLGLGAELEFEFIGEGRPEPPKEA